MTRLTFKSAFLGFSIALTSLAGLPGAAQADGIRFGFSFGNTGGSHFHGTGPYFHGGFYSGTGIHSKHHVQPRRHCKPRRALRKVRHAGVNRGRIVGINRRGVTIVKGRYHGDRVIARVNSRCKVTRIVYR